MTKGDTVPERAALISTLREIMKARKVTAAALATNLNVSPQTLKRLFNGTGDCPLERIVAICACLGVSFFDLVDLANKPVAEAFELSLEQEEAFVAAPHLLEFFYRLRSGEQPADVAHKHGLSAKALQRYLKALEQIGVIERETGNRCRVLVRGLHNFVKDGPLARRYMRRDIDRMLDYLGSPASENDQCLLSGSGGRVAAATARELVRDLKEISDRYRRRAQRDRTVFAEKDTVPVRWMLTVATAMPNHPMEKIFEI